jgi:hypothetical protein
VPVIAAGASTSEHPQPTHNCRSEFSHRHDRFRSAADGRLAGLLGELSAIAAIEAAWVLRQQSGGLLTAAASSSPTGA